MLDVFDGKRLVVIQIHYMLLQFYEYLSLFYYTRHHHTSFDLAAQGQSGLGEPENQPRLLDMAKLCVELAKHTAPPKERTVWVTDYFARKPVNESFRPTYENGSMQVHGRRGGPNRIRRVIRLRVARGGDRGRQRAGIEWLGRSSLAPRARRDSQGVLEFCFGNGCAFVVDGDFDGEFVAVLSPHVEEPFCDVCSSI